MFKDAVVKLPLLVALIILLGGCGSDGGNNNSSTSGSRCRQATNRSGAALNVCCNEGETIVEASVCTYGGFIASCTRPNDNCIERTNDGQYSVNCWSENCKDCPSAPSYDVLITWCADN